MRLDMLGTFHTKPCLCKKGNTFKGGFGRRPDVQLQNLNDARESVVVVKHLFILKMTKRPGPAR